MLNTPVRPSAIDVSIFQDFSYRQSYPQSHLSLYALDYNVQHLSTSPLLISHIEESCSQLEQADQEPTHYEIYQWQNYEEGNQFQYEAK